MSNNRNRRRQRPSAAKRPANTGGNGHRPGKAEVVKRAAQVESQFRFTHHGRTYTLPPASEATEQMPAAHLIDALMGEDESLGELRLGIATLQAADVDPDAMTALRSMRLAEFTDVVGRWLRQSGVSGPEFEGSST